MKIHIKKRFQVLFVILFYLLLSSAAVSPRPYYHYFDFSLAILLIVIFFKNHRFLKVVLSRYTPVILLFGIFLISVCAHFFDWDDRIQPIANSAMVGLALYVLYWFLVSLIEKLRGM